MQLPGNDFMAVCSFLVAVLSSDSLHFLVSMIQRIRIIYVQCETEAKAGGVRSNMKIIAKGRRIKLVTSCNYTLVCICSGECRRVLDKGKHSGKDLWPDVLLKHLLASGKH